MVSRDFDLFDLAVALEVLADFVFADLLHFRVLEKSLNTNFTIFMFNFYLFLFCHLELFELGGLGSSVLLGLGALDRNSLAQQLLA